MWCKLAVLSGAILGVAAAADPVVHTVEEIAAKVNGDIITRGELQEKRREAEEAMRQQGLTGAKLAEALRTADSEVLRNEIDTLLLVQKAKDFPSLSVDADVNRFMHDLQVQYQQPDPDKFHQFIREQTGMTYDEFVDQKKREILAQRVVAAEVSSKVSVAETDLQKYYDDHKSQFMREEEVFLSQILISTEGKAPEQVAAAEARAKELAARARKGEKFSDLARQNSDDGETAQAGGYLGAPSKRGMMRPELEAIVFREKKGYVTDPIKLTSPSGFLILKVEEHYDAGQASFDEVRDQIREQLVQPRLEPRLREYLTQLRQNAFLQIKDGYVDAGAAPGKDTRWQEASLLKPPTTSKEEVLARARPHKRFLGVPIPGTSAPVLTAEQSEKPPKPAKHKARAIDETTPQPVESDPGPKAPSERAAAPMAPIIQ